MSKESIISKQVISTIETRDKFLAILKEMNPGIFILKLGAKWCGPCKKMAPIVDAFFGSSPNTVLCADIDVDECFNLYSFLKSKRMVNGIPALLCYAKGNIGYTPNHMITGGGPEQLHSFFRTCGTIHSKVIKQDKEELKLT
jgi:thiol-disulfide isomerase/thioredoxin